MFLYKTVKSDEDFSLKSLVCKNAFKNLNQTNFFVYVKHYLNKVFNEYILKLYF